MNVSYNYKSNNSVSVFQGNTSFGSRTILAHLVTSSHGIWASVAACGVHRSGQLPAVLVGRTAPRPKLDRSFTPLHAANLVRVHGLSAVPTLSAYPGAYHILREEGQGARADFVHWVLCSCTFYNCLCIWNARTPTSRFVSITPSIILFINLLPTSHNVGRR